MKQRDRLPQFLAPQPITAEQERDLVAAAQSGSDRAKNALVRAHTPYMCTIAKRYTSAVPWMYADVLSACLIGFAEALGRFKLERGTRLLTYATWWMRHHVTLELDRSTVSGRAPSSAQEAVLGTMRRMQTEDVETLAEATGARKSTVQNAVLFTRQLRPVRIHDEEMRTKGSNRRRRPGVEGFRDLLVDYVPPRTPEDEVLGAEAGKEDRWDASTAIEALDPRERRIVELCILPDEPASLAEAGRQLQISRERARQLLERAKAKMRAQLLGVRVPKQPWRPQPVASTARAA